MPTLDGLVGRGYFPRELPPPFTSEALGSFIAKSKTGFSKILATAKTLSKTATHSLARRGLQRRILGIPNPASFCRLSDFVVTNWALLHAAASKSPFSATQPADRPTDRPFDRRDALGSRPLLRAKSRSISRHVVMADVLRFYHSIYTHSIPWALHGKATAKANHSISLLGNRLDKLLRDGQDGQTLGVPVGPDTSLLIAEIILSQVDAHLSARGITNAFRIIDDYEIGVPTLAEAERAVSILQEGLTEYELALNASKTTIRDLPLPCESAFVSELGSFILRTPSKQLVREIIRYFDRTFILAADFRDESVVAFALGRLGKLTLSNEAWPLYQHLLLQCVGTEPSTLPYVIDEFRRYRTTGYTIDTAKLGIALNRVICLNAPLGYGSEVAWAIWGLIEAGLPLQIASATAAAAMSDSVVGLTLLDAIDRGLAPKTTDLSMLASFMNVDDLYGKQWLLAYEANAKGWLPSFGSADHVSKDKFFRALKGAGVTFYETKIPTPAPIPPPAIYGGGTVGDPGTLYGL